MDKYLEPYRPHIERRMDLYKETMNKIFYAAKTLDQDDSVDALVAFANSYKTYGLHVVTDGVMYREWAPCAQSVAIFGDFNSWNRTQHVGTKDMFGTWTVFIPNNTDGSCPIPHESVVKVAVRAESGEEVDRLPQYSFASRQFPGSPVMDSIFWNPPQPFRFQHPKPKIDGALRIYEVHIGMACDAERVGSYREFADNVVPYIADLGYNCVQVMALAEHSYYASFGYQVTSFFSPASRHGTPDDLRYLIDAAHSRGLVVLMDLVHSHASKNVLDGLNQWDGSSHHLFHAPPKGDHPLWDSRLFNYQNVETLRFLLSNLSYWQNDFMIDGFRFDGITSMIYHHHGVGVGFSGGYHEYFNDTVDSDALVYLMLANRLIHTNDPAAITVAEDVSGMPLLCIPVCDLGVGFDYRMAMAVPDMWIKLLKETRDEDWDLGSIAYTLQNRRWQEKYVVYAECHDQALVGDKTIAFRLMDAEMYTKMSVLQPRTPIIDRGIALHKLIRFLTVGLGGEAYLTFMGNEFGHPEWIDFPRTGNGWSYKYCRRQWGLAHDKLLRYQHLYAFEKELIGLESSTNFLSDREYVSFTDNQRKIIAWCRGNVVFAVNLHASNSYQDVTIPAFQPGTYRVALHSDGEECGGYCRVAADTRHFTHPCEKHEDGAPAHFFAAYLPSRTAVAWTLE
ncbi:1 4-alpha-glucan-branching enzyme GlgB [Carpediemonas membranifera]|uniref:1,4-alpha-glucan branching enzyme n=1 Tax=Carpediemonas membranifera TaxID=201153 RepID=A0A8J6DZ04_9EUKA|nr:1 4-alpha-glucan-branching enzyme GlgB [Carpediemonas membranifera]|eukprot:KAG9390068.1 1 4-alpha-glucan-branching enzyme GlgB [Carpediemonas membranifera]